MPLLPRRRPRTLDSRAPRRPDVLHHLGALLSLAGSGVPSGGGGASRLQRRRRQHRALAQRLLDPLPAGLRPPESLGEHFWRALRWGGAGAALAWWLAR